jgi:hypothetical protein
MGADDDDLDRAAILARRQRFIALALSGLATAGACTPTDPPKEDAPRARPSACLKYSLEPRQPKPNAPNEPPPPPPDATPVPCLAVPLDFVPPKPDTARPTACLSVAPKPTPQPKPATPVPCLEIMREED